MSIPKPITLLHTLMHPIRFAEVLQLVDNALSKNKKTILFPMNVHVLVELSKHPVIKKLYERSATIVFCDGVPLVWLSRLFGKPLPERVSGTDLVESLLLTHDHIFLLGSSPEVLAKMQKKYKTVCGVYGPPYKNIWSAEEDAKIVKLINNAKARILLVGLGALKREEWILAHDAHVHATIAAAVGSAFDILSGKTPRAPRLLRDHGLEWIWRLFQEPQRLFKRYVTDAIFFVTILLRKG